MRFFTTMYYLSIGPFIGKFNYAFKSDEERLQLKDEAIPIVMCTVEAINGLKKRKIKAGLKKIFGKDCRYVTDEYKGFIFGHFFQTYSANFSTIALEIMKESGKNKTLKMDVIIKGGPAKDIISAFENGRLYADIDGFLVKSQTAWDLAGGIDIQREYEEFINSTYRDVVFSKRSKSCPSCNNVLWRLQSDGTCDECYEQIITLEVDTPAQLEYLEEFRIDTEKDPYGGRKVA